MVNERTCPRCGETKPASGFYVQKRNSYGLTCYCRVCIKAEVAAAQAARTPEQKRADNARRAEQVKQRRVIDPEYDAAFQASRALTQEKVNKKHREYGVPPIRSDPDAFAAYMREWRRRNPEAAKKISREANAKYLKDNPEKRRLIAAVQSANNRAIRLALPGRMTVAEWNLILVKYEHRCAFCGAGDCLLDLEHVIAMKRGGANDRTNIVPACRPCNAQKHKRTLEEFCAIRGLDPAAILAKLREPFAQALPAQAA